MGKKGRGSVKDLLRSAIGKGSVFDQAPNARKRHTVIGDRNRNSKAHSQTQARERSDQIRRETLLIEHQQRGRTNVFHDGRFGEEEEGMPLEDKLVHRFQRERQRQLRASKYALGDGPEGGDEGAITAREQAGESQRTEIREIPEARIDDAALRGGLASISVAFTSDQVNLTLDRDGKEVAGTDAVTEIHDIWTFERDLGSPDPTWRLVAARSA